ncbi:hypothetical protein KKF61_04095 [Patescibacteria group bacterium]|nr:hypothetical protein [Patescibacteria group bacterium]MBU0963804.1 hypothetical protein [Patescibacteria group bacterium]
MKIGDVVGTIVGVDDNNTVIIQVQGCGVKVNDTLKFKKGSKQFTGSILSLTTGGGNAQDEVTTGQCTASLNMTFQGSAPPVGSAATLANRPGFNYQHPPKDGKRTIW